MIVMAPSFRFDLMMSVRFTFTLFHDDPLFAAPEVPAIGSVVMPFLNHDIV